MIESRRCPSATGPSRWNPSPSGPRCASAPAMARTTSGRGAPFRLSTPQIPHMGARIATIPPVMASAPARAVSCSLRGVKPPVWIGLAVLIKLVLFFYTMLLANTHNRSGEVRLHLSSGDEGDYLMPVENLVRHGWYLIDLADPSTGVHRMPGYAVSYLPFRYLLGPEGGVVAQVAFQVILGGIAAYGAASLALAITGRFLVFLLTLGLGSFSLTSSIFDAYTLCDGLAASVLTLCVWALVHATKLAKPIFLVCGGALFTYALFLRPFLAPLGFVLAIFVWATCTGPKWRQLLLFASVPVLCEGAWIGRNWLLLGRFVPLQTAGYEFPASERAVRDWIGSFGGDLIHWRPGSAGAWVHQRSPFAPASAPLPSQVYTTTCPSNRLVAATELYRQSRREDDPVRRTGLEKEVTTLFTECREAYESEHPLDHHLTARLRLLKAFFIHAGPVLPLPLLSTLPRVQRGSRVQNLGCHVVRWNPPVCSSRPGVAPLPFPWASSRRSCIDSHLHCLSLPSWPTVCRN